MLTAPLFSTINVRDAAGRYPRAVLRVSLHSNEKAKKLKPVLEEKVPIGSPKLSIDRGRVVAEGLSAVYVARAIGWPDKVVEALQDLARHKGIPGVALTAADIECRAEYAARVVRVVAAVNRAALR